MRAAKALPEILESCFDCLYSRSNNFGMIKLPLCWDSALLRLIDR